MGALAAPQTGGEERDALLRQVALPSSRFQSELAVEHGQQMEVGSVLHEKVGGGPGLGDDHGPADVHVAHLMEKQPVGHQAVAMVERACPVQGRVEVGRIAQGQVGKVGQAWRKHSIGP